MNTPRHSPKGEPPPKSDPTCIFCKIIAGEIPCHKLYENDQVVSFLDVGPLSTGHSLVIPRAHYTTLDQMPAEQVAACASLLPALGRAIIAATGTSSWNVLQNNGAVAGQVVNHVHFHLIPRQDNDALGFRWPAGKLDSEKARQLVAAISARLNDG